MPGNGSFRNCCEAAGRALRPGWPGAGGGQPSGHPRPPWVAPALFSVLVFTTVVDVLGNLLVILSVLRNRKLRNYSGECPARFWARAVPLPLTLTSQSAAQSFLGARVPIPFSLI